MGMKFSDLQCKEVICICDGRRLGYISDVHIDMPEGQICAIVVPGPCRILGMFGRKEDYLIPWSSIRRVGPDIVLVDVRPDSCRVPRARPKMLF